MKLKIIDLGNAVPIDRTNVYYNDFEVQSIHYRAPEVCPCLIHLIPGSLRLAIHLRHRYVLPWANLNRTNPLEDCSYTTNPPSPTTFVPNITATISFAATRKQSSSALHDNNQSPIIYATNRPSIRPSP